MVDFKELQAKWQKKWAEDKIFEVSPDSRSKFFMTIPYPYISGSLHIGHARVVTEADVFVRYQRMTGKNVLYPIAFHISGTPVLGISLAIKNGDQKKIDLYKGYVRRYISDEKKVDEIVASFEDPNKIVEFFIPFMVQEFKTLGLSVDWRRSYTSGDNEHQALVEWQFRKYKEKDYLVQGKYPILFSKTLNNAVGEDDIQEGDTNPVDLQEFTLIKFKFEDSYLVAATLRPETMYGQTNMWANPDVEYIKANVDGESWIMSRECAKKLEFQDKKVNETGKISGMDLMGKTCFAPFVEREIMILPSLHCDPEIGSGIVTSVPSDAPFDHIALQELKDSEELCQKYNLDHSAVNAIELIPIIKSKGYGDLPAVEICEKMGITKLSQHDKLTKATQEIYKVGFHTGRMMDNCGSYKGLPVAQAKDQMKEKLIEDNKATVLYETSRKALSRDGGEVLVAILDGQWFLDFNAEGWKEKSDKCLAAIQLWPEKYRKQFEDVFDWLDKRPCARKRGLGTKLPFDQEWVIESLSDSTIYMSLYPIIHLIRENKIKKEQLSDDFFEFIMNSKGDIAAVSEKTGISKDILEQMNKEWNYWYPFDHRHTFTAHLSNHLSFMIFAHAACYEEKQWPKRISFHGMIMSEGDKMSKSKGNVITLMDIDEKFGADSFRAFMCNSTSVESTFNWETDKVLVMKKHLLSLYKTIKSVQENRGPGDAYKKYTSFISKTERAIKQAGDFLKNMDLRQYSNTILHEMLSNYRTIIRTLQDEKDLASLNAYVADRWIKMLAPLVPHLAEELWSMNSSDLVSIASWPDYDESSINPEAEYEDDYLHDLISDVHTVLRLAKLEKASKIRLFISPSWKYDFFTMLKSQLEQTRNGGEIIKAIMQTDLKRYGKDITKIVPSVIKDPSKIPAVLKSKDGEREILDKMKSILEKDLSAAIEIIDSDDSQEPKAKQASPGKPAILVE
ncbi:leucine--tRNA ligase [Nanoarchaeota archaeon]